MSTKSKINNLEQRLLKIEGTEPVRYECVYAKDGQYYTIDTDERSTQWMQPTDWREGKDHLTVFMDTDDDYSNPIKPSVTIRFGSKVNKSISGMSAILWAI